MKALTTLLGVVVLAGFTVTGQGGEKKKGKTQVSPLTLAGVYDIVSGQRNGKPIPKKEIEAGTIRFTGDTIYAIDKEKQNIYAAKYKVDASKQPAQIHMVSIVPKKGEEADGLIKIEGQTVTVIYALPGGETPRSFEAGEKQQLFVLKKQTK